MAFRADLERLINRHSRENGSDTPDFILADYLMECLILFDKTTNARGRWYNKQGAATETSPRSADTPTQ